jgi:hypothetical protein
MGAEEAGEVEASSRPKRRSAASRAFFTPEGRIAWKNLTKIASGLATIIGVVTFVVSLGIRYGELRTEVSAHTKEIEALLIQLAEQRKKRDLQIDRLVYAVRAQNELITHLRIAVAASAAVEDIRRRGRYDRSEVLGEDAKGADVVLKRPVQHAKQDAKRALQRARTADPLAALDQLEEDGL